METGQQNQGMQQMETGQQNQRMQQMEPAQQNQGTQQMEQVVSEPVENTQQYSEPEGIDQVQRDFIGAEQNERY